MSNPWKKVAAPADVQSLSDIMSEEYAKSIQLKAEPKKEHGTTFICPEYLEQPQSASVSDEAFAKMLQRELNIELEDEIKATKREPKIDSKLSVSYNYNNVNLLTTTSDNDLDSNDEDVGVAEGDDWEYFETDREEFAYTSKQSHVSKDDRMAIKNDMISSKRTASSILDEQTRHILCKLINAEEIKGITGVICTGKESIILHAYGVEGYCKSFPKECAIKVFKTTRNKSMPRNKNKYDSGFKTPQELAYMRAEKETLISGKLYFLHNPLICHQIEHVVIMPFIGEEGKPAPNLIDAVLTPDELQSAYNQVADAVKKLYHTGPLVHGRLIGNNIMWWKNECWFINFSQSVHRDHPKSYKFLLLDCHNICNFFKKKGVQKMKNSTEELFEWITGLEVAHFVKN